MIDPNEKTVASCGKVTAGRLCSDVRGNTHEACS
jgi:hypothetical protein